LVSVPRNIIQLYYSVSRNIKKLRNVGCFLVVLVGDVLTKMLMKASRGVLVKGLMENFRPVGLLAF
jgi:hypothetical protein